ncbi:uncharacterized protein LOC132712883 [Ruditapes philippinarum]|uniref:uncharacterized protein LOC132712883 n=1 Tax=Ruditapes philippinarum TaxID=129788 RepID=UPI00295BA04B|nr:uncharacterized protein LOC132712883 [Ruditapes philippinarum]
MNTTQNGDCSYCCNDNFCNSAGCGDGGFQNPSTRGPLCMNCSNVKDKEMCHNIQLCQMDKVCRIEKLDTGNNFVYNMGCTDPKTCTSKRSINGFSPRDVPVCSHCCRPDFCNLECSSGGTGPSIVG